MFYNIIKDILLLYNRLNILSILYVYSIFLNYLNDFIELPDNRLWCIGQKNYFEKKKDLGCEFICNLLQTSTVNGKQVAYLVGYIRRYWLKMIRMHNGRKTNYFELLKSKMKICNKTIILCTLHELCWTCWKSS